MTFLFLIGKSNEVRAFPFVFYNHEEKAGPILLSNPRLTAAPFAQNFIRWICRFLFG